MFFYGQSGRLNVIVSLDELGTGKLLLEQPAAPLNPEHPRWAEWASGITEAMSTGGEIKVTLDGGGSDRLGCRRCQLPDAPAPLLGTVADALDFFARRANVSYDRAKVEVIDLRG